MWKKHVVLNKLGNELQMGRSLVVRKLLRIQTSKKGNLFELQNRGKAGKVIFLSNALWTKHRHSKLM